MNRLAIEGGTPVRDRPIPIFKLQLNAAEIAAVQKVAAGGQVSRGPLRDELARDFCAYTGASHAVVCSSGTSALHMAVAAYGWEAGAEIIVPSLSFVATAFAAEYNELTPVFAEVDPETFNLDVNDAASRVTERTRAIIPVHFAGRPADTDAIYALAREHDLVVIEDAAHAAGARRTDGGMVGSAPPGAATPNAACFSFFATKNMTSAEGGLVTTEDPSIKERLERVRAHGITPLTDAPRASGYYDITTLGYNFHLSDLNIALGIGQLARLDEMNGRRREIAARLSADLAGAPGILLPEITDGHVFHLFNLRVVPGALSAARDQIVEALLAEGIGVGLYYRPIHLFSYYRDRGYQEGMLPVTEQLSSSFITLPLYPALTDADVDDVSEALHKVLHHYGS